MLLPWKVDVPQDRYPVMNWVIIAAIIVAFICQFAAIVVYVANADKASLEENPLPPSVERFVLDGWGITGLFGHMWLHGGFMHLIGNLIFLWIFGNAVCAKIGNLTYLPLYLLFGIAAGISHLIFSGGSAVGASGAIYGVVGMYLIFFPENEITCYVFLIPPIEINVRSMWVIFSWVAFDIWGALQGGGMIAYFAHIGGFAVGVGAAILMLKKNWVQMERYEKSLLQLIADYRNPPAAETNPLEEAFSRELQYAESAQAHVAEAAAPGVKVPPCGFVDAADFFKNDFIRFSCSCGKKVKIPAKFAGKMGKCPNCQKKIRIPDTPTPQSEGPAEEVF